MKNMDEFLDLVKLKPFLEKYTTINPKGGIYHRLKGKSTRGDKPKDLTDDDKKSIKSGVVKLQKDLAKLLEKL